MSALPPSYNPHELFAAIATGDEAAFTSLFKMYRPKLYYFAFYILESEADAEELTQDIFTRLWNTRDRLTSIENPDDYLFIMARNGTVDYLRRMKKTRERLRSLREEDELSSNSVEEDIDLNQSRALVEEAVSQLPKQQAQVFHLSRVEGLNRKEIAEKMGISEHTVKAHLTAALRFIRDYLSRYGDMAMLLILWKSL